MNHPTPNHLDFNRRFFRIIIFGLATMIIVLIAAGIVMEHIKCPR